MSAGASPPVCLSFAGWLLHRLVPCLTSLFVTQPPHTSILDPSSLFVPAGCCVPSLRTASASRRAVASQLAVSSLLPMRRHSCHRCAGVFAVVATVIVTLVASHQAGIFALVVVVINIRRHRCHHRHRRRHPSPSSSSSSSSYVAPSPSSTPSRCRNHH